MATIALISDIHANVAALDVVLAELDAAPPDLTVCLGDVAATGPAPRQVVDRLRGRTWRFVRGNCDAAMVRIAAGDFRAPEDMHEEIDCWCTGQLDESAIAFLASFESIVALQVDGVPICCYHGSPQATLDEIRVETPGTQLDQWLGGHPALLFAGGHTHVQMARRYRMGLIVNPGSVGLPFSETEERETINPLWAEYALVRIEGRRLGVELKRVQVDRAAFAAMVEASGMPHRDEWARDWR